jgi:hypothetical protein
MPGAIAVCGRVFDRSADHGHIGGQDLGKASGSAHRLPSPTVTVILHPAVTANAKAYEARIGHLAPCGT